MTKKEKQEIMEKETIATCSDLGGILIKRIEYSINDHVVFVAGALSNKPSVHSSKIYYGRDEESYFLCFGKKVRLSDCLRCNTY